MKRLTHPSKMILVVDDEVDICLALQDLLESEGYQVDSVESGTDALNRVQSSHPYSSVILDLGLPDLDGMTVLQRIQKIDATIPTIILTARGEHHEKIASLEHNAFAHLTKPYDRQELLAVVQRAVNIKDLSWKANKAKQALRSSETKRRLEGQRSQVLLSESEQRLRLALKAGNMGIWDWTISTGHVVWSNEVASLLGRTLETLDGTYDGYIGCVHAEDRALVQKSMRQAIEEQAVYESEHRIVWPTGEIRWVACKGQVLTDLEEDPQRMVGTIQDVTTKRQTESALLEANQLLALDAELGSIINKNLEFQALLQACTETLVHRLDAAFVRIWILNPDTHVLELQASAGLYTHLDGPHSHIPVGHLKIGQIAAEKKPQLTNAVIGDPRIPQQAWAKREGLVAFAGYPLVKNNEVLGVLGLFAKHTLTDVTLESLQIVTDRLAMAIERQQTLYEYQKLARQHERILASAGEGIYGLDLEGRTTFVNPAAANMLGYDIEELIGVPMHTIMHHTRLDGSPYPREECLIHAVFKKGQTQHIGNEVMWRKDGTQFPVDYTSTPMWENGRIVGAVVTFQDITKRKMAERALQESEARFRQLSEAIPQQVWTAKPDGSLDYVNQRVVEYFGLPSEKLIGQQWKEVIHPDDLPECLERWATARETHQPYEVEFRLHRNEDQTYRWHIGRAVPIFNQEGKVMKWFGTNTDMTELKQLENQVRQTQKMEAIGTLAGGIAHDFNNILMGMIGYAELAKGKTPDNEGVQQNLEEVILAGWRAKELVQQILMFSRQSEQQRQPIELHLIVKEVLKFLRASLPVTIDIQQHVMETSKIILGDPIQLHQVVINLCANAEYAMRESGGILELRVDSVKSAVEEGVRHPDLNAGPYVRLTVRDSGKGITSEVVPRIFDPFFTTKDVGEGSGMGLAVVHGIVSSHGGVITVDTEPNKGTTFTLYFPEIEAGAVHQQEFQFEEELLLGRGRILLVEDEEPLARLGREALEGLGYEVMVRTSSVEALEAFRAAPNRFNAVITDQTMPNLTGEALSHELLQIRSDLPIILCTGFSHMITPEKAKAIGIRAFLLKPMLINDLARTLREVLDA